MQKPTQTPEPTPAPESESELMPENYSIANEDTETYVRNLARRFARGGFTKEQAQALAEVMSVTREMARQNGL